MRYYIPAFFTYLNMFFIATVLFLHTFKPKVNTDRITYTCMSIPFQSLQRGSQQGFVETNDVNIVDFKRKTTILHPLHNKNVSIVYTKRFPRKREFNLCGSMFIANFTPGVIGPCASVSNPLHIMFNGDFPCPKCKKSCVGDFYHTYVKKDYVSIPGLPVNMSHADLTVLYYPKLLPVLFLWGHAFQHFLKDVLPRVILAEELLRADPEIKLLLDESGPVKRILKRMKFPLSRVLWTRVHSPNKASLYGSKSKYVYTAGSVFYPDCAPGPRYTGVYPTEIYAKYKEYLVHREDIPWKHRKVIVFPSRDGGFIKARRIENEKALLAATESHFGDEYTLVRFNGKSTSIDETIEIFRRAAVVIGGHGGAFYNIYACGRGTRVIELLPDDYGKLEVGKFSRHFQLVHFGFVKQKMKRGEDFGMVDPDWWLAILNASLKTPPVELKETLRALKRPGWVFHT